MNHQDTRQRSLVLLAVVLAVLFGAGLLNLFLLRFESGDVLEPYSSQRGDPLGVKVFYESLGEIEGVEVSRNFLDKLEFDDPQGTTLLFLGLPFHALEDADYKSGREVSRFALEGGRVVVALLPLTEKPSYLPTKAEETPPNEKPGADKGEGETKAAPPAQRIAPQDDPKAAKSEKEAEEKIDEPGEKPSPSEKEGKEKPKEPEDLIEAFLRSFRPDETWGFEVGYFENIEDLPAAAQIPGLPESISWHTIVHFKNLSDKWRVVYEHRGQPVLIERDYGQGTLVLSSDSYFFSNEALRREPIPGLLSWVVGRGHGRPPRVVFDEVHLGLSENPGVAALAKKYKLHGLIAGLLVLAGLFIWKSALSLVPPRTSGLADAGEVFVSQKDHTAGLIALLRRGVPRGRLLDIALKEYLDSSTAVRDDPAVMEAVQKAASANKSDPVKGYLEIAKILSEGKRKWNKASII